MPVAEAHPAVKVAGGQAVMIRHDIKDATQKFIRYAQELTVLRLSVFIVSNLRCRIKKYRSKSKEYMKLQPRRLTHIS